MALAGALVLGATVKFAKNFGGTRPGPIPRAGVAVAVLLSAHLSLAIDFALRPNALGLNVLLNLTILVSGVYLFDGVRTPSFLLGPARALLVAGVLAWNWAYQSFRGINYDNSPDIPFAVALSLLLPLLALPYASQERSPWHSILTLAIAWASYFFLLQTQLRSAAAVGLVFVIIFSIDVWTHRHLRLLGLVLGAPLALVLWIQTMHRPILLRDGTLYSSGRADYVNSALDVGAQIDLVEILFGKGSGTARELVLESVGNPNVHSSLISLLVDYGVIRVTMMVLIVATLYFPIRTVLKGPMLDHDRFWKFFSLVSFGFLGLVSEPLETVVAVLSVLIILAWNPKGVSMWKRGD